VAVVSLLPALPVVAAVHDVVAEVHPVATAPLAWDGGGSLACFGRAQCNNPAAFPDDDDDDDSEESRSGRVRQY
jgi:hypothetical protein